MQSECTESCKGANRNSYNQRHGIYADPPGVNYRLVAPGMICPLGWANEQETYAMAPLQGPDAQPLPWNLLVIPQITISHPAHLMLIEGLSPMWMFLGMHIQPIDGAVLWVNYKCLALLKAEFPPMHVVPYIVKDVHLGGLAAIPDGIKLVELVPQMFLALDKRF